jgi:heterodisulfide reductase subunit C
MLRKFKAISFLGCHFFIHMAKKLFFIRSRGKSAFLKDYKPDHIFAISSEQRKLMPNYSSCYHCNLCDTVCPQLKNNLAPSYIVSALSRSLPDYNLFPTDYDCQDCQKCEDICPEHVPIKKLIEFIKETKQAL